MSDEQAEPGDPGTDGGGGTATDIDADGDDSEHVTRPDELPTYGDVATAREVLRASPTERDERGLTDDDVRAAFRTVVAEGDREEKDLSGITLPALDLDYEVVDGTNKHPVDLRGATVERLSVERGTVRLPIHLHDATVGDIQLEGAHVTQDLLLDGATVTGDVDTFEATFDGDLECRGTTFEGAVELDEGDFHDDVSFDEATCESGFAARNAEFFGESHLLDDSTSFDDATFHGEADLRHTEFGFARFEGAAFEDRATFEEAEFRGDVEFDDATFAGEADFDEIRFGGDASFAGVTFGGLAHFRGSVFEGGARVLEADADFRDVAFEAEADFTRAGFRVAEFTGATFAGPATFTEVAASDDVTLTDCTFEDAVHAGEAAFGDDVTLTDCAFEGECHAEEAAFDGEVNAAGATFAAPLVLEEADFREDASFADCRFDALADFDEVLFDGDTTFAGAIFADEADFRGTEFLGDANHLADGVSFADCRFESHTDFDDAAFTSADFDGVTFGAPADFTGATFDERLGCRASATTAATYLDFTDAKIKRGQIVQPESGWVHYDMTRASLGDVTLDAEREADRRELLDYFRFCNTEFDEFDGLNFDFSDHTDYLDRNEWVLHDFDENVDADHEFALELTPAVTETTYLKAKTAASNAGDMKAAGEFRVKRQGFARRKHLDIAKDASAGLTARIRNFSRAAENGFLGLTCGHGMRLIRIAMVFVLAPLLFVPIYTYGGSLFATNQPGILGNLHLSYISYTTIGYGNAAPTAIGSRLLASSEAYLSTVLAALVVYALVKRSEL
jgi:hypothetical protein